MYHHVTKATKGVAIYHQVHDIINEEGNDRKGFSMKRNNMSLLLFKINMDLLICIFWNTIFIVWCILHVAYVYIETKKLVYAIWYYGNP